MLIERFSARWFRWREGENHEQSVKPFRSESPGPFLVCFYSAVTSLYALSLSVLGPFDFFSIPLGSIKSLIYHVKSSISTPIFLSPSLILVYSSEWINILQINMPSAKMLVFDIPFMLISPLTQSPFASVVTTIQMLICLSWMERQLYFWGKPIDLQVRESTKPKLLWCISSPHLKFRKPRSCSSSEPSRFWYSKR